ncbi:MAG: ABC transporter permease [Ilumatobacteraceae bacterium]
MTDTDRSSGLAGRAAQSVGVASDEPVAGGASSPPATGGRRHRLRIETVALLTRIAFIFLFLAVVEVAVVTKRMNPLFVARPTKVASTLIERLRTGDYVWLIRTTLYETTIAFLIASVVGLSIGYLLWRYRDLGRSFDPLFMGLFASPIILLYPVFLIIFQRGIQAVIVMAAIGGVIPIILATKQALSEVNPTYLKVGYLLCNSRWQSIRRVLLPGAIPGLVAGMVLGLTYTLLHVLAVEFLANIGGLGAEISEAAFRLRADRVYAALTLVIILTASFLYGLKKIERALSWQPSHR